MKERKIQKFYPWVGLKNYMNKILPIESNPVIDIYSGVSGSVAIQQLNPNYTPVIISNHFLITYDSNIKAPGFNWSDYNNIGSHYIDIRNDIKKHGLVSIIKEIIDRDCYIQIVLDHYFIKDSGNYHNMHFMHDRSLIYGYDDMKEIFYVRDNFENGRICTLEIPFYEVLDARKGIEDYDAQKVYFDNEINYDLTLDYIKRLLETYLTNENHLHKGVIKKDNEVSYGVALYSILDNLIKDLEMATGKEDVRVFCILINHYSIGKMLCKYIRDKYNDMFDTILWEDNYNILYNKSEILCSLYLKLIYSQSHKVAETMYSYVNEMRDLEVNIITDMLSALDNAVDPL